MRRTRALFGLAVAASALTTSAAASTAVTETAVKAAFLPRFARYVTWPPPAAPAGGDPFVLCVIGEDPFGKEVDSAARTQAVDGRRIVVRRLGSADRAGNCQIAYIAGGRNQSVGQALAALRGRPILTVTDSRSGGPRGMIHFAVAGGRVRFFINEADAAKCGLSISSRLLALAISVNQR